MQILNMPPVMPLPAAVPEPPSQPIPLSNFARVGMIGTRLLPTVFFLNGHYQHSLHKGNASLRILSGAEIFLTSALIHRFGREIGIFNGPYPLASEINDRLPRRLKGKGHQYFFAMPLYDSYFREIQRATAAIKEKFPSARIVVGGPTVNTASDLKRLAGFFPAVDAFVKGDGENVFPELVDIFSNDPVNHELFARLRGIYVRDGDFEYYDNEGNVLSEEDFNSLPFVIESTQPSVKDIRTSGYVHLSTSRGCSHNCNFCSFKYHPVPIYWSADRIIRELRHIKKLVDAGKLPAEARNVYFTDDEFLQNRERAKEFFRGIASDPKLKNYFSFILEANVASFYNHGILDSELMDLIAGVKIEHIVLGIDGYHRNALKFFGKGYTWDKVETLLAELKRRHITVNSFAILTYPSIDRETLLKSTENLLRTYYRFDVEPEGIAVYPIAREGNRLGPLVKNPRYVRNGQDRYMLPIDLKIDDQVLQRDLSRVLRVRLLGKRMINVLARMRDAILFKWHSAFYATSFTPPTTRMITAGNFGAWTDLPETLTVEEALTLSGSRKMKKAVVLFLYSALRAISQDRHAADRDLISSALVYMRGSYEDINPALGAALMEFPELFK